MTLNRVLIDSNICLDVILNRAPFALKAVEIIQYCEEGHFSGWIAAHSFDTIFYILSKQIGKKKAYKGVHYIRDVFGVASVSEKTIDEALKLKWPDFEDAIHYQAALQVGCDAIVTRNDNDFKNTKLPVLSPFQFLEQLEN